MHAAIFTGNPDLAKRIALRPSRRIPMWNGPIECRLLLYDLYTGTRDPRLLRKHVGA
jgi:putative N6-adenine-specific DNA methylase